MIDLMAFFFIYFSIGTFIGVVSLKYVPLQKRKYSDGPDREDQFLRLLFCIVLWPITMFFFAGVYLFELWEKKS